MSSFRYWTFLKKRESKKIDYLAKKRGKPKSQVIREIIERHLKDTQAEKD